jgi:shikimate kinase
MRVYLLGYMGSGKTTLGKTLAKKLKFNFTDLDHFIEKDLNKKISSLFETEGEEGFRSIEKNYLHKTASMENTIVSCGGGTPCFFDNIQWMNNNGITIYLKMTVDGLFNRLLHAKEERPLLKKLSNDEL